MVLKVVLGIIVAFMTFFVWCLCKVAKDSDESFNKLLEKHYNKCKENKDCEE